MSKEKKAVIFKHQPKNYGIDCALLKIATNGIDNCPVVQATNDCIAGNFFDISVKRGKNERNLENCSFLVMPIRL